MKKLLCVALMIKNDAECIERILSSVMDFVEHVAVLDLGSTDNTSELITKMCQSKKKPLKIETNKILQEGSSSRNYLLKMCRQLAEFILVLDPNEECHNMGDLISFLKIKRSARQDAGYKCRYYLTNEGGVKGSEKTFYQTSIIRNNIDEIYYEYPVHERITCSTPTKYKINENLCDMGFYIHQDQLLNQPTETQSRQEIAVLETYLRDKEGAKLPPDARIYRSLIECYRNIKDLNNMFKYCDNQITFCERTKLVTLIYDDDYYHALVNKGLAYGEIGNEEFWRFLLQAYKHCSLVYDNVEPFFYIGQIYRKRNQFKLAYQYLKKTCSIAEPVTISHEVIFNQRLYRNDRWVQMSEVAYQINQLDDYYLALSRLTYGGEAPRNPP